MLLSVRRRNNTPVEKNWQRLPPSGKEKTFRQRLMKLGEKGFAKPMPGDECIELEGR